MITVEEAINIINDLPVGEMSYHKKQRFHDLKNDKNTISYNNQKEHWLNHLKKHNKEMDFRNCYNRLICAPMLCWLAESLDLPVSDVKTLILETPVKNDKVGTMRSEVKVFKEKIPYSLVANRMRTLS